MTSPLKVLLAPVEWVARKLGTAQEVSRDPEEQARVDRECRALALYQSRNSPESIQVRREITRLGLDIAARDIQIDPEHRQALQAATGRLEVPCLRIAHDSGEDDWLFGASAIRDYLRRHFAP
ncbi:glutaredoxin domain-containing protein [Halomonas sp. NO4]|uniref:glutaredoxin family protein n=1 Tax=Halomonas sp. NO4 TaxID=2484813 RepID=UPI0013D0C2FB|nr:glutaredoxin domain-containing protein [Halomonas sp. NO4]